MRFVELERSKGHRKLQLCFLASGSVHTERWIKDFVQRDCEVHWVTFDTMSHFEGAKTRRLRYRSKLAYPLRIIDVKRAVNEINPDVVHALYASHYGVYAALSGFHPLIISALGSDILISPERSKMFRFSLQFALKKADLVHVSDEGGRKTLIELGCDPRKILTQEWGVETTRFSPNARSESLRQRLEIQDCYSVLSASSWQIDYNVDVLIKAMPLVLKQLPDVKFILLGGGVLEGNLKALAKNLRVYENTVFVGRIPYEEMPMYLASVDVFVDTISDYARALGRTIKRRSGMGLGQTTKEAMACGTPQILPDHSSINYKLFKGLTYRQLDHVDLAEKLVHLLRNEELRDRIGQESIRAVVELCDQDSIADRWYRIYHRLSRKQTA
jgi:glycosyltransferase involved in cell wall biosynthesis